MTTELRTLFEARGLLGATLGFGALLLVVTTLRAARLPAERTPDEVARVLFHSTHGLAAAALFLAGPAVAAALTRRARERLDETAIVCAGGGLALTVALLARACAALLVPLLAASAALARPAVAVPTTSLCLAGALLAGLAVALASLGAAVGAGSPSAERAIVSGLGLGGLSLGASAGLVGKLLGAALCERYHVGHHGFFWLPELAADPKVPAAVRATLRVAPFGVLFALTALGALSLRCRLEPAPGRPWHLLRAALLATTAACALVGWRVLALPETRLGREATSLVVLTSVAGVAWLALFGLLAESAHARPRAAPRDALESAWDALFSHGATRAVAVQLAVTAVALSALAWRASRLIAAVKGPQGVAPLAPLGASLALLGALTLASGFGVWLRARASMSTVRGALVTVAVVLYALPYPVLELAGGVGGPAPHAGLIACTSPLYALRALDRTARRRLAPRDLARRGPKALGDVTAVLVVAGLSGAGGVGLLLASRRRRRGEDPA